jgi:NagD protein
MQGKLRNIRHVALDMDGTIYCGDQLFGCTPGFLQQLRDLGISFSFLTNNSSRSARDYVAKLEHLGLSVDPASVHISTHATLAYLRKSLPAARRIFLVGTESMREEVAAAGYQVVNLRQEPDLVLVGFDPDPDFAQIGKAAFWITNGKPFVATHPDRICPTNLPTVLLDCGSVCAMLREATGRVPSAVLGKPEPAMLLHLSEQLGIEPGHMAMVGDRIYTDIEMARRTGALGVLVLSGEATLKDASDCEHAPDLVLRDVGDFGALLKSVR